MSKTSLLMGVTLLLAATAMGQSPQPDGKLQHEPGNQVSRLVQGKPLWTCHLAADGGQPYFHPLALSDGTDLSAFAPVDHPWHRGLWFSWKYLNGVNYWDPVVPPGTTRRSGDETVHTEPSGAVTIDMTLQYAHHAHAVLSEKRRIAASSLQKDGAYTLDWTATFTALGQPVVFDRTSPGGGYGGLSYRAPEAMREIRVVDSEGRTGSEGHGQRARWMDFSGMVGASNVIGGVAIFDHPSNPRYPTPWFVATQGIQYFNAAMLFHAPFQLPAGKSFVLRYRILVHPGFGDPKALDRQWKTFALTSVTADYGCSIDTPVYQHLASRNDDQPMDASKL